MTDHVVLVDHDDNPIGTMEKLAAHQNGGHLHRAFSVLLFDDKGRMMLQQRASGKYHCPNLWTNSCCSHPKPEEHPSESAIRRLHEEMGMSAEIEFLFSFVYQAQFDNGLTEHEFDHVYVGITRSSPQLNHDEAQDRKWFSFEEIDRDISENSQRYTPWFLIMVREYRSHFHQWLLKRGITNQCKH